MNKLAIILMTLSFTLFANEDIKLVTPPFEQACQYSSKKSLCKEEAKKIKIQWEQKIAIKLNPMKSIISLHTEHL